jgi:hypothetical protein
MLHIISDFQPIKDILMVNSVMAYVFIMARKMAADAQTTHPSDLRGIIEAN